MGRCRKPVDPVPGGGPPDPIGRAGDASAAPARPGSGWDQLTGGSWPSRVIWEPKVSRRSDHDPGTGPSSPTTTSDSSAVGQGGWTTGPWKASSTTLRSRAVTPKGTRVCNNLISTERAPGSGFSELGALKGDQTSREDVRNPGGKSQPSGERTERGTVDP